MKPALLSTIDSGTDAEVIGAVYSRLTDHYGPAVDVGAIPAEHRTVILVEYITGIIGNGGVAEFFLHDLPGDPNCQFTLGAFEALSDASAIASIRRVFDVYPNRVPPSDRKMRAKMFVRANQEARGRLQQDFFRAGDAIRSALAKYIRTNRDRFADLSPFSPQAERPAGERRHRDPVAANLKKLPRWAQIAFVARCARLVLPLYRDAWPKCPDQVIADLELGVRAVEQSAARASPTGNLKQVRNAAGLAAGESMMVVLGYPTDEDSNAPTDPDAAHIACYVANAVKHAIEAIGKPVRIMESYGVIRIRQRCD
jgi:Domain of unknown function (DUF4375)